MGHAPHPSIHPPTTCPYVRLLASLGPIAIQAQVSILGWFLHHVPFYIMGRVLYLHHYYPCLYFSILGSGALFDLVTGARGGQPPTKRSLIAFALLSGIVLYTFYLFSPLCYGIVGSADESVGHLRWVSTWGF